MIYEKDKEALKFIKEHPSSTYGIIKNALHLHPIQMHHLIFRLLKAGKIYKTDAKRYAVIDPPAGQRQQKEEEK